MKSAREMFEELGYEYSKRDGYIEYEWGDEFETHWKKISFCTIDEMFCADQDYESMYINMPTFKAIQKQLEELNWI